MTLELQFTPWDYAWVMFDNKPMPGLVTHARIDLPINWSDKNERVPRVCYTLNVADEEMPEISLEFADDKVFATKQELLASL